MKMTWLALAQKGYNLQVCYSGKWLDIGCDEDCVRSAVRQKLKIRYKHCFQPNYIALQHRLIGFFDKLNRINHGQGV